MSIFKRFVRKAQNVLFLKPAVLIYRLGDQVAQETIPEFANKPKNMQFQLPRVISNPKYMFIGNDVKFGPGCMLKVSTKYPGSWMRHPEGRHVTQTFNPRIIIGNNVTATSNLHLTATKQIIIEDHVMFASNVFLADCSHGYEHANYPYKYQGLTNISPIIIKSGAWICQNVIILPGVTIGKNTIIGANSVVRDDIPEKCIAVGTPARVIKKWDENAETWYNVNENNRIKF